MGGQVRYHFFVGLFLLCDYLASETMNICINDRNFDFVC